MSVNKYLDHLLVLPEDDANRNILNRFVQHDEIQKRSIQILPPAGGWLNVLEEFEQDHAKYMKTYPKRRVLLVLDFDEDSARLQAVRDRIPADVRDRVFVLGSWSDPEKLRNALGRSLEEIGASLAGLLSPCNRYLGSRALTTQRGRTCPLARTSPPLPLRRP